MPKHTKTSLHQTPPSAALLVGVARRDVTPPVGIYSRMWGAAKHDVSTGTHRPLTVTALVMRRDKRSSPVVLVSLDVALIGDMGGDEMEGVRRPVIDALGCGDAGLIISCTHTHASPWPARSRAAMPGGKLIGPYLEKIARQILDAAREARANVTPAVLTWATARCDLATNRDLPDPRPRPRKGTQRIVCGYNPRIVADDTVMVGRVSADKNASVLATLVNYACHPTTLAWENTLISPDFIGAMREVVERHTGGAPCLFLQGASGELSPAHQYVGDTTVADAHGRRLGHAALSAIAGMLAPAQRLEYRGVMESGAPLALWRPGPFTPPRQLATTRIDVPVPIKRDWPTVQQIQQQMAATPNRALRERLFRKLAITRGLGSGRTTKLPAWVWRIGQTLIVAHPNEAYSCFQQELRARFPDFAVIVMNVANAGEFGYLAPPELYDQNIYQVWQTPFDRQALPRLTRACIKAAEKLAR